MNYRITAIIVFLVGSGFAIAQEKHATQEATAFEGRYRMDDATQLWRLTDNAAGLGLDSTRNRGYALFNGEHRSGDYARVQEGTQTNRLRFQTERYQRIGKYLHGYGRFEFDYGRTKNRAWADVYRPYNSNPFFVGSDISGKYDFQDFDFTAALGTTSYGGWRFGARLDYRVGDLSRLRDPRSRSQLLDYRITPAITFTTGHHTFGLDGYYGRRKEKIPSVKAVQEDAILNYYELSGMEEASGSVGAYKGFEREWVNHRFGGNFTYAYNSATTHSMVNLHIERGSEGIYGQYKYEPGHYYSYRYGIDLRNRIKEGSVIHQLDLSADYEQAYADEYRQLFYQEKDATTGLTSYHYYNLIAYKKRYQVDVMNANMRYRAHFTNGQRETGYAGVNLSLNEAKNKHLLPTSSLTYGGLLVMAEGGFSIGRLWVDAMAGGYVAGNNSLSLADPTTDYAQQVLQPDMCYYDANYWRGRLQLTYEFPLTIKGTRSRWFVRAYGDYLRANNHMEGRTFGISLGQYN